MDDLQLLASYIETPTDTDILQLLARRCKPVLDQMGVDEKVEAQVVKKIGLDAWCDIHKIDGTIARLIYVYLGQVKTKASKTSMSPKDLHRMILAGKSTAYMARKLNVHRDSVRRAIVKFGYVELYDSNRKRSKVKKIVSLLENNSQITNLEIAKIVGTQESYVAKIRHTHGFTIKTRKPPAEYLEQKLIEGLCAKEIASELGLSHRTIQTYLSGYGIKVGDSPAYRSVPARRIEALLIEKKSITEIADILCKAESTIKTYIYHHKLSHLIIRKFDDPELPIKIRAMRDEGCTNLKIAETLDVSVSYVCAVVKRLGMPSRRHAIEKQFTLFDSFEEIQKHLKNF